MLLQAFCFYGRLEKAFKLFPLPSEEDQKYTAACVFIMFLKNGPLSLLTMEGLGGRHACYEILKAASCIISEGNVCLPYKGAINVKCSIKCEHFFEFYN